MIAAAKEPFDLPIQIGYRTVGQRPAWIDHDVPRCSQLREPRAHDFADSPFKPVAENRLADSSGRRKAHTRAGALSSQAKSGKERPAVTETVVIYFPEIARS